MQEALLENPPTRKRKNPPPNLADQDQAEFTEPCKIGSSTQETSGRRKGDEAQQDEVNSTTVFEEDSPTSNIDHQWDATIHAFFVQAIFEEGLKQASPAVIMEHMNLIGERSSEEEDSKGMPTSSSPIKIISIDPGQVTSERIKSRLQKYRKKADKSREEFISEYDRWLEFANESVVPVSKASGLHHDFHQLAYKLINNSILCKDGVLLGGDMAAFLSFVDQREGALALHRSQYGLKMQAKRPTPPLQNPASNLASVEHSPMDTLPSAEEFAQQLSSGANVHMPLLTVEEQESHLGKAFQQVVVLFRSLSRLLMAGRTVITSADTAGQPTNAPNARSYDAIDTLLRPERDAPVDSDTSCISEFP